jgi:hypothetical protein
MKTHKISSASKNEFVIDRKSLAKIGDSLYFNSEVSGIKIQIKFKDKTKLEYLRHHVIDEIEQDLEKEAKNSEYEEDE